MDDASPWLRPIGTLAVASALALTAVPALAQEGPPTTVRVDLMGASVDLHEGTCADPTLDPWASVGRLERRPFGTIDETALGDGAGEEGDEERLPAGGDEGDDARAFDDADDIGVLEGGEITETGREGDPVEEAAEAAVAVGEEISDELAEGDDVAIGESSAELIEEEREGDVAIDEGEALVDESAAEMVDDDVAGDVAVGDEERVVQSLAPALYVAEGEVDAGFESIFDQANVIAVHQSSDQYETIVACGDLGGLADEIEEELVVGMRAVDGSGVRGYAVFESDPALFGDDAMAVSVYLFDRLPTQRDAALTATPTP